MPGSPQVILSAQDDGLICRHDVRLPLSPKRSVLADLCAPVKVLRFRPGLLRSRGALGGPPHPSHTHRRRASVREATHRQPVPHSASYSSPTRRSAFSILALQPRHVERFDLASSHTNDIAASRGRCVEIGERYRRPSRFGPMMTSSSLGAKKEFDQN